MIAVAAALNGTGSDESLGFWSLDAIAFSVSERMAFCDFLVPKASPRIVRAARACRIWSALECTIGKSQPYCFWLFIFGDCFTLFRNIGT